MTYSDYLASVRRRFREDLGPFLEGKGMEPVARCLDSPVGIERKALSVAVYPSSPKGQTVWRDGDATMASMTIHLFHSAVMSEKASEGASAYYSAILEFLERGGFGLSDTVDTSLLLRTDTGDDFNGALYLLESCIAYRSDWD